MCIKLKEITKDNWIDCIYLSLHPSQVGNLASNVATIAESKFEPNNQLRAIYREDRVIGMLAYSMEDEPPTPDIYWIFRFMIDKDFQNRGYGTKALNLAIEEISSLGAKKIYTSYKPKNEIAAKLYRKVGFSGIGKKDDGDWLMEKNIDLS